MTISERYGEFYLLTSPFTNTIGCYRVVSRIAAAEMGLSQEEFMNVVQRLQDRRIAVCVDDYILVRTWFRHNSWEATFSGNVAKAAAKELAGLPSQLREHWVQASLDIGVPEAAVHSLLPEIDVTRWEAGALHDKDSVEGTYEGLSRVSTTPSEGQANYNHNHNKNNKETKNTTPTPLFFDVTIEPHRKMLLQLLSGIDGEVAQTILDELAGALESVRSGTRRKPIGSVRAWVGELVNLAASGNFVPELAPAIRERRGRADSHAESVPRPTARDVGRKNMDAVRAALISASAQKRDASCVKS
ncbi:hypothetical protein FVF58_12020 [Paraburkholderia panacisoli]|uniref:Uncharacterized protein n=1 Tax=Paraburkholderia panacisoli TaxID=2603818 RepID=A0A5B0HC16_9BURK|nr:hypothetical protein [Paraburkholderia panacisoli]KAA1012602.1 hypothetical protein FVF58_12020 [Paraburkholderia panacisoli]